MRDDPRELLPRHKHDTERAEAIVALGYPTVAPLLADLVEWLQDINWPVAHVIAPFLARIGAPIIPEVRRVLRTDDVIWKCWVLRCVVAAASPDVAEGLRDDLTRIAAEPTAGEILEDVSTVAQELLQRIGEDHPESVVPS